jgi:hypothetical protein
MTLLVTVCLQAGGPLLAAPTAEVEDLIRRGGELRKNGEDAKALPLYQRAHELAGTPRTAAQLGLVEVQLGYRLEAAGHLSEALAARGDNWIERYRAVLDEQLQHVKSQIGELSIAGSPAGADVRVNGRLGGQLPLAAPIRVVAGQVLVEMSAEGYTPASATVNVRGQSSERVMLNLARAGAATSGPDVVANKKVTSEKSSWTAGKVPGVAAIVGGGLAVFGGATLLLIDKHETCDTPAEGMCKLRNETRLPGWSLIGVGAAAVLTGAILIYNTPSAEVAVGASPSSVFMAGRF